jgi:hypothetical protein
MASLKLHARGSDFRHLNAGMRRFSFTPASTCGRSAIFLLFVGLMAAVGLIAAVPARTRAWPQKLDSGDFNEKIGAGVVNDPELRSGFQLLYQLKFDQAREGFAQWQQKRPAEPLGPALEAASDLFEEFYRKGVLTSEFFLDDNRMLGGIRDKPDPELERQFASAVQRAQKLARARMAKQPKDPDALFALTLIGGMQADDFFLIQRRQLDSMHSLRETERNARILLGVAPDTDDAYLALGVANYVIGCLPTYKRAVLWMGGVHGDKTLGMQQVARAAASEHARYLRPFARLMLALAALREKDPDLARLQLQELTTEFPENPLFAKELAKITPVMTGVSSHDPR